MCRAVCVYNNREAASRRPQAYDLVNAIPEELLIGFQCNSALLFLDLCFFAEKLLVDLDLLSRSKMGHLHNFQHMISLTRFLKNYQAFLLKSF
jgi:hypothetical protein